MQNVGRIFGPHVLGRALVMPAGEKTAGSSDGGLRLTALSVEQMAQVLSAASGKQITEEMMREAIDAGAPSLHDGWINLIEFTAWLEKEMNNR